MEERIEEFLESRKTESTKEIYNRAFVLLREYNGSDLSMLQLLQREEKDRRKKGVRTQPTVKMLNGFVGFLEERKKYAPKTINKYMAGVLEFFSFNELPIHRKKLRLPKDRPMSKNKKWTLTAEDVKKYVEHATTVRDKCLVAMTFQGGFRASDLVSLNVGDVLDPELHAGSLDDPPLVINAVSNKTGKYEYKTAILEASCNYLKSYLEYRERQYGKLSNDDPLFAETRRNVRMGRNAVGNAFRDLAEKGGLVSSERLETGLNPCRPHALRLSFGVALSRAGCPSNYIDHFQGHEASFHDAYFSCTTQDVRDIFKKYSEHLRLPREPGTVLDDSRLSRMEKETKLLRLLLWKIALSVENYDFDPDSAIGKFLGYMDVTHGSVRENDIDYLLDILVKGEKY